MKKIISTFGLCIVLLTTSLIGYAMEQQVQLESKSPRAQSDQIIVFQDPILEQILIEQMGKPDGEITVADAQKITELRLNIERGSPEEIRIRDISGLEYFTNLETLQLLFHAIQDITPLANLTNLRMLSLGGNEIQDITPLSQLTNLEELTLFNCQASDYSPLRNLINLRGLMLEYSTISDLSPLANLTNLQRLSLSNPQITDITPLTNLVNLTNLQVGESSIEDFSPIRDIYPNLLEKNLKLISHYQI